MGSNYFPIFSLLFCFAFIFFLGKRVGWREGVGGESSLLGIPRVFDVLDDFLAFLWEEVEMTNTLTLVSKYT